jgi:hypothetical protein
MQVEATRELSIGCGSPLLNLLARAFSIQRYALPVSWPSLAQRRSGWLFSAGPPPINHSAGREDDILLVEHRQELSPFLLARVQIV